MWLFILRRIGQTAVTAVFVSMIVFSLARVTGDPTILLLPSEATEQDRNFFRNQLGLDKPLHEQYLTFLGRVLEGDMGNSFRYREPALDIVMARLPATLELAAVSMLFAIIIALPIGILAAVRRDSWIDTIARWFATLGQATPTFWLGLILMIVFGLQLGWLPISGTGSWEHFVMPAVVLAFTAVPRQPNSRLSCQITLSAEMNGLAVTLPASQY